MYSILNLEQLITLNGVPNAHGKFYVYKLGRTELADIWYDPNGETILPNPLDLDNLGMGVIYVSNLYDYTVVCCDPYNNELFSRDIFVNSMGEGGNSRLYEGLDPICVNNEKLVISAKKATLSVQDPLYFVEDSPTAVCIGLQESAYSGLPYIENSAIELDPSGNISAISGHSFHSDSAESAGIVTDGWETGSDGRITAYNGTAFSAGKVYSGISPVYVNNESDLIGVSSKDFLANSPLYFTEYSDRVELSISGLPDTPGLMYESGFNYESGKITGYNGSGISAGKVYSGIDPVHVDNVNDTISLDSATLGVQAPLYFVEDSESATIIGLNTAQIQIDIPESANWNEAYSTVANNSGDWQSAADELAVLNTAKWDSTCDYVSSHSADWNNKLDADIYAEDSGTFLTALPSDLVYTADLEAVSAEITGMIPTALTGDYIETSAMKSVQLGTSAFITGFYDRQISATFANGANKAISASRADSAISAGSASSASYVYSGWGATPTLYHKDSAIKQYYAVTGSFQGFPAGTLYKFNAYSADSASVAASAEKAEKDSLGNIIAITYLTANQPISQSADWNSAASTVSAGYANWDASYGTLTANSANWDSTYTTVSNNSASWAGGSTYTGDAQGALDEVYSNSGTWNSTTDTVSSNSANWNNVTGKLDVSAVSSVSIPLHGLFVSGIDNKPIFAKDALSANYAKYDVNGRSLTRCLTAVPAGTMNESNFGYDVSNNITAYNGSAFKAASQITRGIDSNPDATGYRVFTWPETGNAQNINVVDYTNNNMLSVNAGSLSWNNAQGVNAMTLASADVQKFKKATAPLNMNSYDNPGWETAGTITTGNPFGVGINFAAAYDNYYISNSRCVSQYLGNSLWNIDLYVSFTGTPKNNWYLYSDFLTIQSGHFSAPTNSFIRDQWNNSFGCLTKDTIYSTGLDYIAHEPHTPTNAQFINLHTLVAEW